MSAPSILDRVEARLLQVGGKLRRVGEGHAEAPVKHLFVPGLYVRTITMAAGDIVTSAVHRTEHPFVVHRGRAYVYLENEARWELIQAPHMGVTKPGTRRLLVIVEETVWSTFHPTDETDVAKVEAEILEPHHNPLLEAGEGQKEVAA